MVSPVCCLQCPAVGACVFADLPAESFARLQQLLSLRQEPARKAVVEQGERPPGVFLVRSGLLRLLRLERSGRMADLGFARPGALLGITEVVTGSRASLTAETYSPCELEFIPRRDFVPFLRTTPELAVELLTQVSDEVEHLRLLLCDAATRAVPAGVRLLAVLEDLREACGEPSPDGTAFASTSPWTSWPCASA